MKAEDLFWELAAELRAEDPRVVEGTIMNRRCLRVGKEFLALVDYKGSGLVVKLPKSRVAEIIDQAKGQPFAPAGKVFKEWLSVPKPDRRRWRELLREGVAYALPSRVVPRTASTWSRPPHPTARDPMISSPCGWLWRRGRQ